MAGDVSTNNDLILLFYFKYSDLVAYFISSISDLVDDELVRVSEALAGLQPELLLVLGEAGPQPPQGIRGSDKHGVADLKNKLATSKGGKLGGHTMEYAALRAPHRGLAHYDETL